MAFVVQREVGRQLGCDLQPWFFIFIAAVEPGAWAQPETDTGRVMGSR